VGDAVNANGRFAVTWVRFQSGVGDDRPIRAKWPSAVASLGRREEVTKDREGLLGRRSGDGEVTTRRIEKPVERPHGSA
jgi:hypothetical protein